MNNFSHDMILYTSELENMILLTYFNSKICLIFVIWCVCVTLQISLTNQLGGTKIF